MGKRFITGLLAALFALTLCACSSSTQTEKAEHRVFQVASQAEFSEYSIITYGAETHKLMGHSDQMAFNKSAGYEASDFADLTVEDFYPNTGALPFMSLTITEDESAIYIILSFKDLDKKENFLALYDAGLLVAANNDDPAKCEYVDADTTCESIKANGNREVKNSEIPSWVDVNA